MKKAFTMIELIFIIIILGILAAAAIPRLAVTRDDAKTIKTLSDIRMMLNDISNFRSSQGHLAKLSNMTNIINLSQDLDLSNDGNGSVYYVTNSPSGKQNCIKITFINGDKIQVEAAEGSDSKRHCKTILNHPTFKLISKTFVIGGQNVIF